MSLPEPTAGTIRIGTATGRWIVAASVLGSGIAAIDATVVSIALPTIGRQFHTGLGPLQWVVTGYTLTLGAFLLVGGSAGDRFGLRRVFSIGVAGFAVTSAACGLAPDPTTLILMRVAQGVFGALLVPASLAILQACFHPDDRARAIGAWSGLGGLATAAGPLVGGWLISAASWRWVFFVNVPVAAFVLALTARHVPASVPPASEHALDVRGAVTAAIWLAGLTYGLIEGPARGWASPSVLATFGVAVASFVGFVHLERRTEAPMLPFAVFRRRQFTASNAVTFVVYGALSGALFLLPVELQIVSRYSPLGSGLALCPVTFIMLMLSSRSGRIAARIGPRLQMGLGPVVVGAGLALLVRAADGHSYVSDVLPAMIVFGLGLAITVAPLTSTAMASLPADQAGLASAVNNDVARVAGLIAVALLPVVAGITGNRYLDPHELSNGFRRAMLIAAGLCCAGGALAAVTIRNPARHVPTRSCLHCALDAPPLEDSLQSAPDPGALVAGTGATGDTAAGSGN